MKKIVDELGVDQTAFDEPGPDLQNNLNYKDWCESMSGWEGSMHCDLLVMLLL